MTWQDELRQLDEELAAGRLSAEDYRRQRDELLSQSASTAAPAAPRSTQPPSQPSSGPFPPPFRWDESPSESTQYISPIQEPVPGGADPTQVVSSGTGDDAERTQVVHGRTGDAERTQVVPGRTPPPPGFVNQQDQQVPGAVRPAQPPGYGPSFPPWQQSPGNPPPWGGSDLPPHTDVTPSWLRQGPEAFEAAERSNTGKIVLAVLGVVLVLGLAVAAFFVFRPDSNSAGPSGTTTPPAATTTAPPTTTSEEPKGPPVADLPGLVVDTDNVETFADMAKVDYLTPQETQTYTDGGATETKLAISKDGSTQVVILITKQADQAAAAQARNVLADLQLAYGLAALQSPPGVLSGANDAAPGGPLRRAHYASDGYVVRVQVQGPDLALVNQHFTEILGGQLDQMPADAR